MRSAANFATGLLAGISWTSVALGAPEVRLGDAFVLRPYVLLQYDLGSTFAHSRDGGPGAGSNPRHLRLGAEAQVARDVEAILIWDFGGTPGNRSRLYQASLAYSGLRPFTLTGGVFKSHFSLEEMTSSADILFLERAAIVSAASGLAAGSGRTGVQVHARGERWLASVALTGGETGPGSDSGQRGATARVAGLVARGEGFALHLGFSGALSWRPPREDGEPTVSIGSRPELALDRWDSPVATGGIAARRARTAGIEAGVGLGRLWAQGEAYRIEVDRARPGGGTPGFFGWYAGAAYTLLGRPREWKAEGAAPGAPKPEGGGFDPVAGRWGALEIAGRISVLDLSDRDLRGGRQRVLTAGLNWWPIEPLRVTLQLQHAGIRGTADNREFGAVVLRGQVRF